MVTEKPGLVPRRWPTAQQEELRQPINDQGQDVRATGTLRAWQWEVTGQERMVQGQQELRE